MNQVEQDNNDLDPNATADIRKFDRAFYDLCSHLRTGLEMDKAKEIHFWQKGLRSQLLLFIRVYETTHWSMRILVSRLKKDPALTADAVSLAREQVEKIFTVMLIISDPQRWLLQYLRVSWRSDYEEHLLNIRDNGDRSRFHEYLFVYSPAQLDKMRRIPQPGKAPPIVVVSNNAKRAVKYAFTHPNGRVTGGTTRWPQYFRSARSLLHPGSRRPVSGRDYLRNYFYFPTPGSSLKYHSDRSTLARLERWLEEYRYICQHSHVHVDKCLLHYFATLKHADAVVKLENIAEKMAGRALFISYAALVSVATEIADLLDEDIGIKDRVHKFWTSLSEVSLPVRDLYTLYERPTS